MLKFLECLLVLSSARAFSISPANRQCSVVANRRPLLFSTRSIPIYSNVNGTRSITKPDIYLENENSPEDDDLNRILATPPGELSEQDASSLRTLLVDYADKGEPEKAQKVILRMIDERSDKLQLTSEDFNRVYQAWSESGRIDTSRNVGTLFYDQEDLYRQGVETAMPNEETLRTVLRILSSSRERGADRRVYSIFERVKDNYGFNPDAQMFASVIRSLARSRERDSAERAERFLREAIEIHPPGINSQGEPVGVTVDSFNVILTAWAKSGLEEGPKQAEQLLVFMDEVHKEHGKNTLTPNVSSFTSLIDAYAQTNEWTGVSQSEQILNSLVEQFLDGEEELEPNVASWTIVISAWNRLARKNKRGAAERADRLLRRMEELYAEGRTTVKPDAISYNTVMNAMASTKTREGVERAEEILDEMNEQYLDGEDELKPTARSLRVIIDAWVRLDDRDVMDRAENLLDRYEEQIEEFNAPVEDEAAIEVYRSMIFGWSKNGDPGRAELYLDDMLSMSMKPDSFCYDRIIESYNHLNLPDSLEKATRIFELMKEQSKDGSIKPNERVYTSYIRALAIGKAPELVKKASMLLNEMKDLCEDGNRALQPTTFTYNSVLRACAESASDEDADPSEAFKVAAGVFNTLRNGRERPDHVSFGNMIRCALLLPEGEQRDSLISSTFRLCCQEGLVNSYVVRDLQDIASEELWRSLLQWPEGDVDVDQLPLSWRSQHEQREAGLKQRRPPPRRR